MQFSKIISLRLSIAHLFAWLSCFYLFKCRHTKKLCRLEPEFQKCQQRRHVPKAQMNDINEAMLWGEQKTTLYPKEVLTEF